MAALQNLLNFVLHLDDHLIAFIAAYGMWTYALLFAIIFCESGIVFAAFLPGDSLLFATGAISAHPAAVLNVHVLFILLMVASVAGNGLNYFLGKVAGPRVFRSGSSWMFNRRHIDNAHRFYERYGGKAIVIARFIPIIRTLVPFIAGIGYMTYRQFFVYNLLGAFLWIGGLVYGSYLFGNIPLVQQHFSLVILAIIGLSVATPLVEFLRHRCTHPPMP
jgi:membrane-associated protein